MKNLTLKIDTFMAWSGNRPKDYPRRVYVKRCEVCGHKKPEHYPGSNCPKCHSKEALYIEPLEN